ncbi:MAG: hypothetical protein LBU57_07685 [Dysgonamonadaceae bacterium]|jgi:hypothetical protein|nr:hypothetical protein [Dysgonamonadaceae bacterium]
MHRGTLTSGAIHIGFTLQEFEKLKEIICHYFSEGVKYSKQQVIDMKELKMINWN